MLSKPTTETSPGTLSPSSFGGAQDLDRRQIVGREDGGGPVVHGQQRTGGNLGVLLGEVTGLDQRRVELDAALGEGGAVALLAKAGRLEVGATGEESDPPMAEFDEMARRLHATFEVLRIDGGEARPADMWVDRDDGLGLTNLDDARARRGSSRR